MGSEEACGEGNRKRKRGKKKQKKRKHEKNRKNKKEKNYFIQFKSYITKHSTAAEELQKSTTTNI